MKLLSVEIQPLKKRVLNFLSTYHVFIVSMVILLVVAFVTYRINALINPPLNQAKYDEQVSTLKRTKFDEEAIKRIQELNDTDVQIDPNFSEDRENPFTE